jgi:hypothetical protein
MVALALMLMFSIIMRTKFLVWVIIKTLSLNMKMLDVLLHRRIRIIGMRKFSINKVLRYTKSINKYISFAHALANIAFKKDIFLDYFLHFNKRKQKEQRLHVALSSKRFSSLHRGSSTMLKPWLSFGGKKLSDLWKP